jgi:hypothetical protein
MQHVHSGKARADHNDIVSIRVAVLAGTGLQGGHLFALPDLEFSMLPDTIQPDASKRKSQIGRALLCILQCGTDMISTSDGLCMPTERELASTHATE